jgi:hypothetical protein
MSIITGGGANTAPVDDIAMLRSACSTGCLDILKWIVEKYGLTKNDIIESCCLNIAVTNNRNNIVEWIMSKFGIGKDCDTEIVHHACNLAIKNGFLNVVMTIIRNGAVYNLNSRELYSTIQLGKYALQLALRRHSLANAQIIIDTFELTYSDIEAYVGNYPTLCESKGLK